MNGAGKRRTFKLGRAPRSYDPRVPHMSALMAGKNLTPPPAEVDNTKGMPADLGMLLNDNLGDSTCAAVYHAIQVWTFNATKGAMMDTEPDSDVELLYEFACGYNPKIPGEGPGGTVQQVLKYLLKNGFPTGTDGKTTLRIAGFIEIDPRNIDDVKRAIWNCGCAYIGFQVPASIMPPGQEPPKVWTVDPDNTQIVGGHAVVLAGYSAQGARVISWGSYYTMTWDFFAKYVDEVYAIAEQDWIEATGKTPGGLTVQQIEDQMQALRERPSSSLSSLSS